jgi:hypothetical protein
MKLIINALTDFVFRAFIVNYIRYKNIIAFKSFIKYGLGLITNKLIIVLLLLI